MELENIISLYYEEIKKPITTAANTDEVHYSVDYVEWLDNKLIKECKKCN